MSVRPEASFRLRKHLSGTGTLHAAGKTGTQNDEYITPLDTLLTHISHRQLAA
jgi:hypothetical protein